MPRLFVAVDIPETVKERLTLMSCGVPGARWVSPDQMHLTLSFIGEVDSETFGNILEVLAEISFEPFLMQLSGVGFFPPRGRPKVLWVGVEPNQTLLQLQQRVDSILRRRCRISAQRKFSAHITLARLKNSPSSKVGNYLSQHALYLSDSFEVNNFSLYSSVLGSRGAKHFLEQHYLAD